MFDNSSKVNITYYSQLGLFPNSVCKNIKNCLSELKATKTPKLNYLYSNFNFVLKVNVKALLQVF